MNSTETKLTTRAITAQDWKDIEQKLTHFYSQVKLVCDGYPITICLERISQMQNRLRVYVNGVIMGKWFLEDCEERRRFMRPRTKQFHSKKELAKMRRIDKKWAKEWEERNTYTYYEDGWTSFRSLKSHLIKQNKVIELVVADERS